MKQTSHAPLLAAEQERVRKRLRETEERALAVEIGISYIAMIRAAAGRPVLRGTRALVVAWLGVVLLLGCGRLTPNPDDAGDATQEAGTVATLDAGNPVDAAFQEPTDAGDSSAPDAGNPDVDANTCAPDECDCTWLALNCSYYAPVLPCGVSAACAQTFDVDTKACTRTVHTEATDAGACALRDDHATWCCP